MSPFRRPVLFVSLVYLPFHGGCNIHYHIDIYQLSSSFISGSAVACLVGCFINLVDDHCHLHYRLWVFLSLVCCLHKLQFYFYGFPYPWVMIPGSFNSLWMIILDLLSVFGLQDIDPFIFMQLINDVVNINRPDMVDSILPSRPHFICSLFVSISKDMVSHGTAQPLVIII